MLKRLPKFLLEDILQSIERIAEYTKGMAFESFLSDQKSIDAVIRNLEIIGEASNQLPLDFRTKHAHIEWGKIVGLRHRIVHDYFGIDLQIVWNIIREDLPLLDAALKDLPF